MEIKTCDPSTYTMDHPDITVSDFMGNSIGIQRVNLLFYLGGWGWGGVGVLIGG